MSYRVLVLLGSQAAGISSARWPHRMAHAMWAPTPCQLRGSVLPSGRGGLVRAIRVEGYLTSPSRSSTAQQLLGKCSDKKVSSNVLKSPEILRRATAIRAGPEELVVSSAAPRPPLEPQPEAGPSGQSAVWDTARRTQSGFLLPDCAAVCWECIIENEQFNWPRAWCMFWCRSRHEQGSLLCQRAWHKPRPCSLDDI